MPLVWELARVCGEEAGGYVHWGATTQNILETGDNMLLREAHSIMLDQLGELLGHLADIAEKSADMADGWPNPRPACCAGDVRLQGRRVD